MTLISHGLLESAPDAVVVSGPDGHILRVNSQAGHLFGYSREELVGWPVDILLPERVRAPHTRHRGRYLVEGGDRGRVHRPVRRSAPHKRKGPRAKHLWLFAFLSPICDSSRLHLPTKNQPRYI
jgi:PAS domain S-box-containing protein